MLLAYFISTHSFSVVECFSTWLGYVLVQLCTCPRKLTFGSLMSTESNWIKLEKFEVLFKLIGMCCRKMLNFVELFFSNYVRFLYDFCCLWKFLSHLCPCILGSVLSWTPVYVMYLIMHTVIGRICNMCHFFLKQVSSINQTVSCLVAVNFYLLNFF